MKILLLDHGRTYAGGQVMAARLAPALRDRGFEVDVFSGCRELEGEPIPERFRALRALIRDRGPRYDLVYANTARTAIAAATTPVPFVWHKHLPETTLVQRRFVAPRARRIISVARCGAPAGDHVRVIYNGVPEPGAVEPAPGLPEGPRILLLGRLEREKGHDLALEALARMRTEARLIVAGPGEWYLPPHPRVVVLGMRRDVPALLAAADVLLNASRFDEGAPLVVLEAQMAGLPIVATRVGGTPEIVRDGVTAFLVPKEDPEAMAAALDRALEVDREAWRAQGRDWARRFTLDACADAIADVLRECV